MSTWGTTPGLVHLPDGRSIRGVGRRAGRGDAPTPDFAVYLLGRDPQVTTWPNRWVRWRDFGLPHSTADALAALRDAHTRAETELVEISCGGGVGRTGTALAALAVMSGVAPTEAVDWVHTHYHPRAVETRRQRAWVANLTPA